ncbi:5-aminolevulinate synthase, partial [Bienertia sinuspersici]
SSVFIFPSSRVRHYLSLLAFIARRCSVVVKNPVVAARRSPNSVSLAQYAALIGLSTLKLLRFCVFLKPIPLPSLSPRDGRIRLQPSPSQRPAIEQPLIKNFLGCELRDFSEYDGCTCCESIRR